jgi:soluble lytic murein transglycosylase-like protein
LAIHSVLSLDSNVSHTGEPDFSELKPILATADQRNVTWWLALLLMQNAQTQADRVRRAMAASLEQQRASVARQVEAIRANAPRWTPPDSVMFNHSVPAWECPPVPKIELSRMIDAAAYNQGLDPALIREVAREESGFHPCAVSWKGAEGIMQIMPATQLGLGISNPFDPQESLQAGSKLLKELLDRYHGNLSLALSAYNAGAGAVDRAGGIPAIPETQNYVVDILGRLFP